MPSFTTNDRQVHEYSGESAWRRLCAKDKGSNIISLCSHLPHRSILEIGAGDGAILRYLSERGFGEALYAAEVSDSGVAAMLGIPRLVDARIYDGYRLPYQESFDLAVLSHVLEHVEHPRQLLNEASRVAKHIFVEVPLEDTWRLPRDFMWDEVGHINAYSPKSLRRLVQSCGLEVLHQVNTNPSLATYVHRKGPKGAFTYCLKQMLLQAVPRWATMIFTYHGVLIARRIDATTHRHHC